MRSFALAIATLLMLSSCTNDPQPIEPKGSATPKPTDSPPTIPASAKDNTPAGAANFVKYWIDSSNHAAVTGDTDQLKKLSDPDCGGCNSYIEFYESTYSKGGYFKGGDRTIGNVDLEVEGDEVYIRGSLKAAPGSYRTTKSAPERDSKAEVTRVEFAVKFGDSRWRMIQLGLGQKG